MLPFINSFVMREVKLNINLGMKTHLILLILLFGFNAGATDTPPVYITGPSTGTIGSQSTYVFDNGMVIPNMTWWVDNSRALKVSETQNGTAFTLVVEWIGPGSTTVQAAQDYDIMLIGGSKTVSISGSAAPPTPSTTYSITHHCNGTTTVTRNSSPGSWYTWYWQTSSSGSSTALGSGASIVVSSVTDLYLRARSNYSPYQWSSGLLGFGTITPYQPTNGGTISGDQNICYGANAGSLLSITNGSGGSGPSYAWERSTDGGNWSDIGVSTSHLPFPVPLAPGVSQNYFRRRTNTSCGTNVSNTVIVNVYPALNGGTITGEQTICYNQLGAAIQSTALGSGGTGTTTYQWHTNTGGGWSFADGLENPNGIPSMNYTNTVSYRRVMTNACGTVNSNAVTVTVRPPLSAGVAGTAQTICAQSAPATLNNITLPSGGDGNYSYQWKTSADNVNWSVISGATGAAFSPLSMTSSTYYQRYVSSCLQTVPASSVLITVNPLPTGGTISPDQTICAGSTPATLENAVNPVGNSTQWELSTNSVDFEPIPGATSKFYSPGQISTTAYFRRKSTNSCGSAYSNTVTIAVYTALVAGSISGPATVCYNTPATLTNTSAASGNLGPYTYEWEKREVGGSWQAIPSTNSLTYTSPALLVTTEFRRKVSTSCTTSYTGASTVTVHPILNAGTPSGSQTICSGSTASVITSSPSGGNGSYTYQWQSSMNNSTWSNIPTATGASFNPGTPMTTTYYHVLVTSCGQTLSSASAYVTVNPTPAAPTYSLSNAICGSGSTLITVPPVGSWNQVKWYNTSISVNSIHVGQSYQTPAISATRSWYITVRDVETGCESAPRTEALVPVFMSPAAPAGIDTTRCGLGPGTLRATPAAGADGIRWYSSPLEGVEVHADDQFETAAKQTTYYYAASYVSSSGCISPARTPVAIKINELPNAIVTQIAEVYGSGSVPLKAQHFFAERKERFYPSLTDTTDFQFYWYVDSVQAKANAPIAGKGILYNTPPITQSKEYYARIRDKETNCLSDVIPINAVITPYIIPQSIKTEIIRVAGVYDDLAIAGLNESQKTTSITYMDGVGRVHQQVIKNATPNGNDIVQPVEFDQFGRPSKNYLPYAAATTDGSFQSSYKVDQANFYLAANDKVANDSVPFAISVYEDSPLGRIVEQSSVGKAWQPGSNHTSKITYGFNTGATSNTAEEVRKFNADGSSASFYAANILDRVESTDPDGNKVITFSDPQGQVIVTKQQLDEVIDGVTVTYLETYYIYDDFGRVKYMIQPRGVDLMKSSSWNFTAIKDQFVFQYVYDKRGRVIEKKVPGSAWNYVVYDQMNRPVLMQDAMLRANNQWTFLKYDSKGHVVMSGLYTDNTNLTRASLQTILDGKNYDGSDKYFEVRQASTDHGYSNLVFPTTNTEILFVSYYDSHDFNYDGTADQTYTVQNITGEESDGVYIGKATGSKTRVPGTNTWLQKYVFYDSDGRVAQVRSNNHLNTSLNDVTTMVYDFEKVLLTKNNHDAGPGKTVSVVNEFEYDTQGRAKKIFQKNDAGPKQLVTQMEYNALGQVVDKKLHGTGTAGSETFLQSVDYRYTIQGQLASINNAQLTSDGTSNDETNDYFGMELLYNGTETGLSTQQKYNGNISAIKWKSYGGDAGANGQKSYTFNYDKSGKLETAAYTVKGSTGWNQEAGAQNESMTYDHNGNIKTLQRAQRKHQLSGVIASYTNETVDNLSYTYASTNGNSLTKVEDASGIAEGFNNGNANTTDYTYDVAGNLTSDKNKGIDSIRYNFMGKPVRIKFADGKAITYLYDAAGNKIKQKLFNGAALQSTTDYVNGFVYENGNLQFFSSPGGRVVKNTGGFEYQYAIADHQGNTRVVFTSATPTPDIATTDFNSNSTEFDNDDILLSTMWEMNHSTSGVSSQRLTGGYNAQVGATRTFKVYPGDKVKVDVYAKFRNLGTSPGNLLQFATALTSAFGLSPASTGEFANAYAGMNSFGAMAADADREEDDDASPKGFITILVFDKHRNFVDAAWDQIDDDYDQTGVESNDPFDLLTKEVTIKEEGYVYIFLSNEHTNQVDIHFDDFKITHTKTNIIQYNEYYPFGLQAATSWTRENNKNDYLYNAASQLNNTSGWYDLAYRNYDASLGRFMQIDPLADFDNATSPFAYGANNPVVFNDPMGLQAMAEWLPGVSATAYHRYNNIWNRDDPGFGNEWYESFANYAGANRKGFAALISGLTSPTIYQVVHLQNHEGFMYAVRTMFDESGTLLGHSVTNSNTSFEQLSSEIFFASNQNSNFTYSYYGVTLTHNAVTRAFYNYEKNKNMFTEGPEGRDYRFRMKEKYRPFTPQPFRAMLDKTRPLTREAQNARSGAVNNPLKSNLKANVGSYAGGALGIGLIAFDVHNAVSTVSNASDPEREAYTQVGRIMGSIVIGYIGAEVGAAGGFILGGGVGAIPGAFIGGAAGSYIGANLGSNMGQTIYNWTH
jgi:RHS repeat-associated protein